MLRTFALATGFAKFAFYGNNPLTVFGTVTKVPLEVPYGRCIFHSNSISPLLLIVSTR